MALLRREDAVPTHDVHTILGPEAVFDGLLVFEGTVRLEGKFKGEARSDGELIIGPNALSEATLHVGSLVVMGKHRGNVVAQRSVDLQAMGELHGNLETPQLSISKDAVFEGHCKMRGIHTQPHDAPGEHGRKLAVIGDDGKGKGSHRPPGVS